jgi:hypothetical protein
MSTEHATLPAEDTQRSHGGPDSILNTTKVVRLFVPSAHRTEEFIRAQENPTRADVFVDRAQLSKDPSARELKAKSIGKRDLVDHHEAHHQHKGSVVVLKAKKGDQIEWQCDVPFRVLRITKVSDKEAEEIDFPRRGDDTPDKPFIKDPVELRKAVASTPIRSGAIKPGHFKQLYKAHFELEIDGQLKILDPDFYCDGKP